MNQSQKHDEFDILGTWEIDICEANDEAYENLKGVRFSLDEGDDVTWHLTALAEQEILPLFSCKTFEFDDWSEGRVLHFYMPNAGDWIEFKVSIQKDNKDQIILKSGKSLKLNCSRVIEETVVLLPRFSLLGALNEGYFSDLKITASNGEEFNVHRTILSCLCPMEDWSKVPHYMKNLPSDVLRLFLHYLYTGSLPDNPSESTVKGILRVAENVPCFKELVKLCTDFLEATAVITRITNLLNDIEKSMENVLSTLNNLCSLSHDGMMRLSLSTEPSQVFEVSKIVAQQVAVVSLKFVLLCDIFSKRKTELTRQERHGLIKSIRDRIPVYAKKMHCLLVLCQDCLVMMNITQKKDIATYFAPKIETFLKTLSEIGLIETLDHIVEKEENDQKSSPHSSFSGKLSRTLKKAVHIRELKVLRMIQEEIASLLSFLFQRREDFCDLSADEKVRSMVKGMNKMIERELPDVIDNIEKVPQTYTRLKFKEWKSLLKVGTAQISCILETIKRHKSSIKPIVDFIQKYEPLQELMVDVGLAESVSKDEPPIPPYKPEYLASSKTYRANHINKLSKAAASILETGKYADMTFIVSNAHRGWKNCVKRDENESDQACSSTSDKVSRCQQNADNGQKTVEFKAHRVIVAARCHWFKCALTSGMKESIDRTILVPDTSPAVFCKFLETLYGEVMDTKSLTTEQLIEMMILTDVYEMSSMKDACESALCTRFNSDNVIYLLSLADRYNTPKLKEECIKYVTTSEDVLESEEFDNLTKDLQHEIGLRMDTSIRDVLTQNNELINRQLEEYGIQSLQECTTRKIFEQHAIRCHRATRIEKCIQSLTEVLGDSIPRRELIRVTLAANCDVNRALNFYFSWQSQEPS
ncbi:uncharacterized protein LOC110250055 [Exaiptasia diaphana]|uniref:BTB domain-containing protein n=1 Tax=Exaiptasia diaphana TaxID=2652724 RepID=A0A913XZU1_EXADI|nr:uncharacterized protein LOC110250055 [Exaiptasia diaphana]KXJ07762.1 BTB/POZ domain-containing protein 9 [Exaiptasia diaphana]